MLTFCYTVSNPGQQKRQHYSVMASRAYARKSVCSYFVLAALKPKSRRHVAARFGCVSVYMYLVYRLTNDRGYPGPLQACTPCIQGKNGTSTAIRQSLDVEYDFYYLGCYGFIGILRVLQYFLLGRGLRNLANGLDEKMKKAYKAAPFYTLPCRSLKGLLLLLMLLTALVYFALGLATEIKYSKTLSCVHYSKQFVAYIFSCIFNLIVHIIYIFILVMMMGASETMKRMLLPPDVEEGTSIKE